MRRNRVKAFHNWGLFFVAKKRQQSKYDERRRT
jgi:hypothetical protein